MNHDFCKKHLVAEQTHWFLRARRALLCKYIAQFDKSSQILEIGCSSGALINDLISIGFHGSYGIDINKESIEFGKQQGRSNISLVEGIPLPYSDNMFDLIVSSDVLEHINNDDAALKEWFRVLRSGGRLLIMVPAYQFLWSEHDIVNEHFRRYTMQSLQNKLRDNGFNIVRGTYWNFFLFFPVVLFRLINNLVGLFVLSSHKSKDQLFDFGNIINYLLIRLLGLENYLILNNINLPFGVSVFVEAKK